MNPTGTLTDDGRTLVLVRRFSTPIDDVWASIVESDRLARWYGTWSGDPATGSVLVTMNAEGDPVPAARHEIRACDPPHLLSVSVGDEAGAWELTVRLAEDAGTTTLTLRQERIDPAAVADLAPGWEWYLDRLVAAVADTPPPTLADFESTYAPLSAAYAASAG